MVFFVLHRLFTLLYRITSIKYLIHLIKTNVIHSDLKLIIFLEEMTLKHHFNNGVLFVLIIKCALKLNSTYIYIYIFAVLGTLNSFYRKSVCNIGTAVSIFRKIFVCKMDVI